MKQGMELNGVANIIMLIASVDAQTIDWSTVETIKEQAKLLERYMIAYNKAINEGTQTPAWHEVRENPSHYPNNSEL